MRGSKASAGDLIPFRNTLPGFCLSAPLWCERKCDMNWTAIWLAIYSMVRPKAPSSLPKIRRLPNRRSVQRGRLRGINRSKFVGELAAWFESDFAPTRLNTRSEKTVKAYQCAIRALSKVLCRPAEVSDLNDETISKFAANQLTAVSIGTVLRHLDCLLAMSNFAWTAGRLSHRTYRTTNAIKQLKLISKGQVSHELV